MISLLLIRRPIFVKCLAVFIILFTIIYLIIGLIYFFRYLPFYANCFIDMIIHSKYECWIGPDHMITAWHIFVVCLLFFSLLWFAYAYWLFKYSNCVCLIPCLLDTCEYGCCNKKNLIKRIFYSESCCTQPRQCEISNQNIPPQNPQRFICKPLTPSNVLLHEECEGPNYYMEVVDDDDTCCNATCDPTQINPSSYCERPT